MAPIIVNFDTQANLDLLYMFTLKKHYSATLFGFFLSRIVGSGLFYLGVFNLNPILFFKINFVCQNQFCLHLSNFKRFSVYKNVSGDMLRIFTLLS